MKEPPTKKKLREVGGAKQNGLPAQSAKQADSVKLIMLKNSYYYPLDFKVLARAGSTCLKGFEGKLCHF
jgi:hypothetical protein